MNSNDREVLDENKIRDRLYSNLLNTIIDDTRNDRKLKTAFFWIVIVIFAVICIISTVSVLIVALKDSPSIEDIATVLSALGTTLGAVIALPTIIAKHLFPPNGEEVRFNFMKDIKKFDLEDQGDANTELDDVFRPDTSNSDDDNL